MSYGFRSVNTAGTVQIDQDFSNYHVIKSGQATSNGDGIASISFSQTVRPPLVAVQGDGSSIFTLDGLSTTSVSIRTAYPNVTFNYKIYSDAKDLAVPTSGHGMVVYRANGDVAFSSEEESLKVNKSFNFTYSSPSWNSTNVSSNSAWFTINDTRYIYQLIPTGVGTVRHVFLGGIGTTGGVLQAYTVLVGILDVPTYYTPDQSKPYMNSIILNV